MRRAFRYLAWRWRRWRLRRTSFVREVEPGSVLLTDGNRHVVLAVGGNTSATTRPA